MKKHLSTPLIIITLIVSSCDQKTNKYPAKSGHTTIFSDSVKADPIKKSLGWMCLGNDQWVPVLGDVEEALNRGRQCYKNHQFEESANHFKKGAQLLKDKSQNLGEHGKNDVNMAIEYLNNTAKNILQKKETTEEIDASIYKVCDVNMKYCYEQSDAELWISDDDYSRHLDSAYAYLIHNDSINSGNELQKLSIITDIKANNLEDAKGKSFLKKSVLELKSLKTEIGKGNKKSKESIKYALAKTYYSLVLIHYYRILDNWKDEKRPALGKHLISTSIYLEHTAKYYGLEFDSKEKENISKVRLMGNELSNGVSHSNEEIEVVINYLKPLVKKFKFKEEKSSLSYTLTPPSI